MSDPSPQVGAPLHGPGGLLGTMGLGARRRKGRRWGMRTKAKQIVGNLYRGDTGKFQAGSGGTPSGATPKRGFVLSKQPKPTARTPIKAAPKPKKGRAAAKKPSGPKPKDPAIAARQAQRDREHADDRAQRQADRQMRRDRQAQRDAERAKKQLEVKQPKGGGGGAKKPSADEKKQQQAADRAKKAASTASQVGMAAPDLQALRTSTESGGVTNANLSKLGLVGSDGLATDQGRRALLALERGDVRQYQAALQDAKARMGREQGARDRKQQAESRRTQAAAARTAKQQRVLNRLRRQAKAGITLTPAQRNQLTDAGLASEEGGMWRVKAETYGGTKRANLDDSVFAGPERSFPIKTAQDVKDAVRSLGRTKHDKAAVKRGIIRRAKAIGAMDALPEDWRTTSFVVFKDHAGQHRWIARTTTAYRDRDGEIISSAALDADSQRMTTTKQFGPLRYWHVGQPDPFDMDRPWGSGLDIGDCDYSTLIGRTRVESGTFRDQKVAQQVAQQADRYELSPGFFHPLDQPDSGGVFHTIRTFERSIVPLDYGRASNLFTGMAVKETRMDIAEMEKRFKAAIADLGLTKEQALAFGQQLVATEKDAKTTLDPATRQPGVAFKSDDAPDMSAYPDVVINGVTYKAAAPPLDEGSPEEEAAESPEQEQAEMDAGEGDAMDGEYLGDMSWDDFAAKLSTLLAPVLKMQDMVKSIGDAHSELKGMYGGVAQKDDARAAELTGLKAQYADQERNIAQLAAKIAQIEGDQPATILPDDVAAALKSTGPAAPADPSAPEIPDDPNRPFAAIAARTMPALYRTDAGGGFAGWTPPPAT